MRLFWPTLEMLLETPPWVAPPAIALDPRWFPSLGPFPSRLARLDSDALSGPGLAGRGVLFQQGPGGLDVAVFVFDGGVVEADLALVGSRPMALLFHHSVRLAGRFVVREAGARRGGPGLAAAPGGGGGFGGTGGAPGGASRGGGPGQRLGRTFEAGSGGQPADAPGGLGGGALQLGASERLHLEGIHVEASGRRGRMAKRGAGGGGGSGGAVVLHGREVLLDRQTTICVRGGDGGPGRAGAPGGGGGGGGVVLGASESPGRFDPRGARFLAAGGRGGPASGRRSGSDGHPGVIFLAARRDPRSRAAVPLRASPAPGPKSTARPAPAPELG